MSTGIGGTVEHGQVISLTQRSARRREYDMHAGEAALGWLRWRWGWGCHRAAQAEGRGVGLVELASRRRRVAVTGGDHGAETLATVDCERGGAIIHAIEGHPLSWERAGRGHRWAIREQGETLLGIAASQGLLRSSVRISVERAMPEETAVLLCLIAGYLALGELQSMADASAAVAGIVATSGS